MNKRQIHSLARLSWDMTLIVVCVVLIGNTVMDIPYATTAIGILMAAIFAILGLYFDGKPNDDKPDKP